MTTLSDYAHNIYSADGEDGCVAEILRRVGEGGRVCVEFGASDGLSGSNTANLWNRDGGWRAVLIEADTALADRATAAIFNRPDRDVQIVPAAVSAIDPEWSIDAILDACGVTDVDFMSVDVDGDDYWIVTSMACRPRVLCVEFNRTVPPHLDLVPTGPGNRFGVGALTMRRAMGARGYTLVGRTLNNLFFVTTDLADHFTDLETDLAVLLPPESFSYCCSDFDGRMVLAGAQPAWGLRWPASETRFAAGAPVLAVEDAGATTEDVWRQTVLGEIQHIRVLLDVEGEQE